MKDEEIENIEVRAKQFRAALEVCDRSLLPISFEDFPRGSCGDAALLLAKFLQDLGLGMFDYVCGGIYEEDSHNFQSHAWLERNDLIVDITADQFEEVQEPVLVTRNHTWHSRFKVELKHMADYEVYDARTKGILSVAYKAVISQIAAI